MNHYYRFFDQDDTLIIQVSSKTPAFHNDVFINGLSKAFKTHIARIEVVAPDEREYILCAANWYDDGNQYVHQPKNINTGFVIAGRRHHNVITSVGLLIQFQINPEPVYKLNNVCEQGFITSLNRWVDREEGAKIALSAGQITKMKDELFSEDLY